MSNDILVIVSVDVHMSNTDKDKLADRIKDGLDNGVIIKDKTISNIHVIDKDKKEMITLVY